MSAGPLRVAFVGRAEHTAWAVPATATAELEPLFVDHRAGSPEERALADVRAHHPHLTVLLGLETVSRDFVAALACPVMGWEVAPDRPPSVRHHPDVPDAAQRWGPHHARAADVARVVRGRPLPVDDRLFDAATPGAAVGGRPRVLALGHSSERREALLIDAKHHFDLLHVAHGLSDPEALRRVLSRAGVAVEVRDEEGVELGHRVPLHLAAGMLLLSEPLPRDTGLRAGEHYVEVRSGADVVAVLDGLVADPSRHDAVRVAGRAAAEGWRASAVWPALARALV